MNFYFCQISFALFVYFVIYIHDINFVILIKAECQAKASEIKVLRSFISINSFQTKVGKGWTIAGLSIKSVAVREGTKENFSPYFVPIKIVKPQQIRFYA